MESLEVQDWLAFLISARTPRLTTPLQRKNTYNRLNRVVAFTTKQEDQNLAFCHYNVNSLIQIIVSIQAIKIMSNENRQILITP